jgi:ParB family chromosome partitioning protein
MTQFFSDSIFWIETGKINPNPFQPRKEFDEARLKDLAESIRQYGVLQPIVVTRKETTKEDGGIAVEYELISGERRLRASKMAGIPTIPAVIRSNDESNLMKLELAIIENLQREDLNCVDRAKAFQQLVAEFGFKHTQIAAKMGKSREYVSNSLRILALPEHMLLAVSEGKISEGHTRPLLMLTDRKDEQETLFKEIIYKKITVRDAEMIARKIATERARKKETVFDPEITALEEKFAESLGTRVHIEKGEKGGKITIDFFSNDDVRAILELLSTKDKRKVSELMDKHIAGIESKKDIEKLPKITEDEAPMIDDRSPIEKKEEEESEDLYSVKNFSL